MSFATVNASSQRDALRRLAEMTQRAIIHPRVVKAARTITADCPARDDQCELEAIYQAVKNGDPRIAELKKGVRYVADPLVTDWFAGPHRLLEMCEGGACAGDCLPTDTKVLSAGYGLVDIGDVRPGDVIMGDGGWTRVTNFWDKGEQPLLAFELGNGCVLRCTADHRVYRVPRAASKGAPQGTREAAEEVRAGDLRVGDDLLTADRLPFGPENLEPDKAWLLGVHIADGWVDYAYDPPNRVNISGKDGFPKEAQKRRVEAICTRLELPTRWHERYIAINDGGMAAWLAACGRGAKNKHVPSLSLDEASVRALLEGLSADAAMAPCPVFGTISETLALQLRILHRMLGQSVHIRRVDEHGGLGKNPIYRVTVRRSGDTHHVHARIKAIIEAEPAPTVDIEVEGHRFYLPETDLIVHNCDEQSALIAALAGAVGFPVGLRVWGPPGQASQLGRMTRMRRAGGLALRGFGASMAAPEGGFPDPEYVHVYAVAGIPKRPDGAVSKWVGLDTTVNSAYVGWEPNRGYFLTAVVQGGG